MVGGPRVERRPEGGVTIRFPEGAGLVLVVRGLVLTIARKKF